MVMVIRLLIPSSHPARSQSLNRRAVPRCERDALTSRARTLSICVTKNPVTEYTALEIALRRGDESSYRVDLHFNDAGGEAEERLGNGLARLH